MTRPPAAPAVDYRASAADALGQAAAAARDAHPDDRPLALATLATGYAAMTIASAIMTTGTRIARALEDISARIDDVNKAIR